MNKNVKSLMIVLILIIVISVIGLVVCLTYVLNTNGENEDLLENELSSEAIVITEQNENSSDQSKDTSDDFTKKIITKYGVLKYPQDLAENLEIEETSENDVEKLNFSYMVDNRKIELFSLCFGEIENGLLCGYFISGDKMVPFSVVFSEFSEEDSESPEEFEIVCMMQEAVNNVIDSAFENDNFVKAN